MEDLLNQIVVALRPETLGDFIIYAIFILSVGVMIFTPEKNDQANYLTWLVMFSCVIDLLRGNNGDIMPIAGFDNTGFGTMILHVIMGIAPFIIAGIIRIRGRQNRLARPLAIVAGVIGSIYAIGSFAQPNLFY